MAEGRGQKERADGGIGLMWVQFSVVLYEHFMDSIETLLSCAFGS